MRRFAQLLARLLLGSKTILCILGALLLAVLVLGCGSGQEKGQNKDLDRPKSTDKGTKPTSMLIYRPDIQPS